MAIPGVRSADRFGVGEADLPVTGTVAALAARTTAQDWFLDNEDGQGLIVIINVTAKGAAPSVVFTIRGYDPASDTVYDLLSSAAVVNVGQTVLQISPSLAVVANSRANTLVPEQIVLHAAVGNADSLTYSVGAVLTP